MRIVIVTTVDMHPHTNFPFELKEGFEPTIPNLSYFLRKQRKANPAIRGKMFFIKVGDKTWEFLRKSRSNDFTVWLIGE